MLAPRVFTTWDPKDGDPSTVVVVEGVIDALTARCSGWHAMALPNGADSAALPSVRDELQRLHAAGTTIIIGTDRDDAGNRAADELARHLDDAGADQTTRLEIPYGAKDLNELLLAHGKLIVFDAIDILTKSNHTPNSPRLWLDAENWPDLPVATAPWIVQDVLRVGDRAFVIGIGDSLKTTFARGLAVAASQPAGTTTNVGPYAVHGGSRVLFINEEIGAADARRHLLRIAAGLGCSTKLWPGIELAHLQGVEFSEQFWIKRVQRVLRSNEGPWVVIVDSFRHILGSVDENHGSEVLAVLKKLDALSRDRSITWVHIAHEAKCKGDEKHAMAGSTAPYAWCDVALRFSRKQKRPAKIVVTKARNIGKHSATYSLDVSDGPNEALVLSGGVVEDCDERAAPTKRALSRTTGMTSGAVLAALRKGSDGPWTKNQIRARAGAPSMLYEKLTPLLDELERSGELLAVRVGRLARYALPDPQTHVDSALG